MGIRDQLCEKCKKIMKEYDKQNNAKRKGEVYTMQGIQDKPNRPSGMNQKTYDRLKNLEIDDEGKFVDEELED